MTFLLFSGLGADDEDDTDDGGDDLLGGDDDGLLGDDLGFDDDDGGSDDDELNYRLDEVEKEIDSLGNKVETVRGENEKISDSISSVERNVDKLVDLYEIVTHGINPFVGDQEIGNAFETATEQGGFGASDDPTDEIDPEIADAEATDFLTDDIESDDDIDDFGDDPFSDLDGEEETDSELDDEPMDDKTADDEFDDFLAPDNDDVADEDPLEADDDPFEADDDPPGHDDDPIDHSSEIEDDDPLDGREDDGLTTDKTATAVADDLEEAINGEIGEPPYLVRHPAQNGAEITTLEWLEFLVESGGIDSASRTIAYYETVGWISSPVETYLQSLLNGFGDESVSPADDPDANSPLGTSVHRQSLRYIATIATPERTPDSLEGWAGSENETELATGSVDNLTTEPDTDSNSEPTDRPVAGPGEGTGDEAATEPVADRDDGLAGDSEDGGDGLAGELEDGGNS
ncbi:FlaD/FlaE family flagellar protein [Natrarchaeobius chitinivorans]|uniref:Flagella protein n=1 Tax=Natrarchaeobius chitinivorans TaxID=1679083 RepID=A0A3N6M031_NATCH|nr:FlaD/FlaE family flagellar protein [Natrarchaeobius chitinivorans]RQG93604.1 flagella protein [Natrarchaeobius chitinivorans]